MLSLGEVCDKCSVRLQVDVLFSLFRKQRSNLMPLLCSLVCVIVFAYNPVIAASLKLSLKLPLDFHRLGIHLLHPRGQLDSSYVL